MTRYFEYSEEAITYLKSKDKKLAQAIDAVGPIQREMDEQDNLFSCIVHNIVGQQISASALKTVWGRMQALLPEMTPAAILEQPDDALQTCGITYKKVEYIKDLANNIQTGKLDLDAVSEMSDEEAIATLSSLKGIGVWTAEMLLLFCLNRMDIFSYGDLAIHRGIRMVYHHRSVSKERFEKYRRRFSPYGSVASLYFWAISHMDVPGYDHDYAPLTDAQKKARKKKASAS